MPRETAVAASTITGVGGCCPSIVVAPLAENEAAELAAAFAALADPVRLRLFSLVAAAGEICSCELLEPLGKSQPTVSHHTRVLSEAGLITGEKRGRWVWWSIVPDRLARLSTAMKPADPAVGRRTAGRQAGLDSYL